VIKKPLLYNHLGNPISGIVAGHPTYSRDAAKRTGSMQNWLPRRLFSRDQEAREREDIVARSINLVNDDPSAAGIIESFATTIIGAGLKPNPTLSAEALELTKEQTRKIELQQKAVYKSWSRIADAAGRMTDGEIQHLKCRCLFGLGESLEIIIMNDDPTRPYALSSQVIHPFRLKTPVDKAKDGNIRDGVEIGKHGQPIAYWIKKATSDGNYLSDSSENFVRIPTKKGHRWLVLHDFITKDPEQFRGFPIFAPAMRYFRDLSDLLGAELTSSVITAALSLFVESDNPSTVATAFTNQTDFDSAERMQEMTPGGIWYGSSGEKPHLLAADRPGTTFDPFTRLIKKTISMSTGVPYQVLFKDLDGISFAGYRSAMLEAWRVYDYQRQRIGQKDCQRKYTMLMEEAYLLDQINMPGFYDLMHQYTDAAWYGAPKGDIEPYKAIQADLEKWRARVKPLEKIIIEDGGAGFMEVAEQIEEEVRVLEEKKLLIGSLSSADEAMMEDGDKTDGQ